MQSTLSMASSTGRESFRDFNSDFFAGQETLSSNTRLFTKQTSLAGLDVVTIELPETVDYSAVGLGSVQKERVLVH